jgi:hypothetical protein
MRETPIHIRLRLAGHFAGLCSLGTLRRRVVLLDSAADDFLLGSGSISSCFFGAAVARVLRRGVVGGVGSAGGLATRGACVCVYVIPHKGQYPLGR